MCCWGHHRFWLLLNNREKQLAAAEILTNAAEVVDAAERLHCWLKLLLSSRLFEGNGTASLISNTASTFLASTAGCYSAVLLIGDCTSGHFPIYFNPNPPSTITQRGTINRKKLEYLSNTASISCRLCPAPNNSCLLHFARPGELASCIRPISLVCRFLLQLRCSWSFC